MRALARLAPQQPRCCRPPCVEPARCCCPRQQRHQPRHHRRRGVARAVHEQDEEPAPSSSSAPVPSEQLVPAASGINWYCWSCLGLLFATDFTPLGQWLLASAQDGGAFALRLALLQWAAFLVPSVAWVRRSGWDVRATLKLRPAPLRQCLAAGLVVGPLLWLALRAAIALKTTGGLEPLWDSSAAAAGSSSSGGLLLSGAGAARSPQQVLLLLLTAAVSPAVVEELLFRGLLLTSLSQRLGRVDARAVCALLFALIHLEPSQLFVLSALGFACGTAVRDDEEGGGSVAPAVALHAGFNATALLASLAAVPAAGVGGAL